MPGLGLSLNVSITPEQSSMWLNSSLGWSPPACFLNNKLETAADVPPWLEILIPPAFPLTILVSVTDVYPRSHEAETLKIFFHGARTKEKHSELKHSVQI